MDNCNLLLYGLPNHLLSGLKSVQNHAARIIKFSRKFDPITPVLKELHWLPVRLPVSYLQNLLHYKTSCRTLRSSSQGKTFGHMKRSSKIKSYGDRAFEVTAPKMWNTLPLDLGLLQFHAWILSKNV